MEIIVLPRGKGKTTEAIKRANEEGAYLLVHDLNEARRISSLCVRLPVTFDEFLDGKMRRSWVRKIVIDNADMFIQRVCESINVEAITLTKLEDLGD